MKQFCFLLTILLLIHCQVFGQSLPTYVPTNGLVGWWPFNGNANDESGNGNNGTVNGSILIADRNGISNSAYLFDGINDWINIPSGNSTSLNITSNYTVTFWFKTTQGTNAGLIGFGDNLNSNNGGYLIAIGNGPVNNPFGKLTSMISANWYTGVNQVIDNNWHFASVILNQNTLTFMIDNVIDAVFTNVSPPTSFNGLRAIGARNNGLTGFFNGNIDDIGTWNRALTQQEITNLYQTCQLSLTSQPSNQTIAANRNARFSVVSSDSNSTYRWQSNSGFGFQDLYNAGQYSGVNTSTLHVSNTSPQNDNQLFRCIVSTQNCGTDTSDVATLNVNSSTTSTGVPNKFTYQSVIRDSSGQLMTNHAMGVRLSLQRGPHMTYLYTETHQLSTNSNGLLTTTIGSGQSTLGSMDTIDWSVGMVYVKTEIDMNGGSNYSLVNTRELLSVPYALYSLNSGSSTPGPVGPQGPAGGPMPSGGSHGQVLVNCNGILAWGGCTPLVTTSPITYLSGGIATSGGVVTSDGGSVVTARGVVYGTSSSPTLSNSFTTNGTGSGSFTSVLSGLATLTTYYVRAYATNSVGTGYGNEVSFTITAIPSFTCGASSVADLDGNTYNTVQIGTQCWTQSNMKVSKYRNGDNIPTGLSNSAWQNTTSGAYAIYDNDPVNDGLYGKLYNHYAVTDSRGLCPTGWHVPSDGEWTTLVNHLGGISVAGGTLKSTAMQPTPGGWNPPNVGATNSSGFTALPGGTRYPNGDFDYFTRFGYWWSSSVSSGSAAWNRSLSDGSSNFNSIDRNRPEGLSVRCLKDSSSGGGSASLPTVTTTSAIGITSTGATTGGNVTADGGASVTARGVAYGMAQNPTISGTITNNGTGTGVFTSALTGLTASTLYYARAYATNSVGTAYGNEVSFTTNPVTIGSNHAGGIVFYVDGTGQHGLVCAPNDQGFYEWGCHGTNINGTLTLLGTGQANTNQILSGCSARPIAASICDNLVLNGYSDWYLPSINEAQLMYSNLFLQNIGGFTNGVRYWSSSQVNTNHAWGLNFANGNMDNFVNKFDNGVQVRAVRAF